MFTSCFETIVDTIVDTLVDTIVDTIVDTLVDTIVDTIVDTLVDTLVDTIVDTLVIPNKNNTLFDKPPIQKTQKNKQPCWQAYLTLNTKRPTTLLTNLKFLTKTIRFVKKGIVFVRNLRFVNIIEVGLSVLIMLTNNVYFLF
jgi:hypothetical protein